MQDIWFYDSLIVSYLSAAYRTSRLQEIEQSNIYEKVNNIFFF